jgi:two-component system, sensor histidine kinase and response regulator
VARVELSTEESLKKDQRQIQHQQLKTDEENCGKVLIVEDEAELAEILEFNLFHKGFDVQIAPDGWEVCSMIRLHQSSAIAKTPIIMLSTLGTIDDRIKGYDLGADICKQNGSFSRAC